MIKSCFIYRGHLITVHDDHEAYKFRGEEICPYVIHLPGSFHINCPTHEEAIAAVNAIVDEHL